MTDITYRDGDLAALTIKVTHARTRAVRVTMPQGMQWMTLPSGTFFNDDEVNEIVPLVTLDPTDDDGDRHRVAAALGSWWDANRSGLGMARGTGHTMRTALEAADHILGYLATPPADQVETEVARLTSELQQAQADLRSVADDMALHMARADQLEAELNRVAPVMTSSGERVNPIAGAAEAVKTTGCDVQIAGVRITPAQKAKPEMCTSLIQVDDRFWQCTKEAHGPETNHGAGLAEWTDTNAAGHVVEGGA